MSRRAPQAPYERHLRAQDPLERAETQGWFPTCRYSYGNCGEVRGVRADGRWYSMCDDHRLRHNRDQSRSVQNRRRRAQGFGVVDVDADWRLSAPSEDPLALMSDERLFGELMGMLATAPPAVAMAPLMELDLVHDENDCFALRDDAMLDFVDRLQNAMEFPVPP